MADYRNGSGIVLEDGPYGADDRDRGLAAGSIRGSSARPSAKRAACREIACGVQPARSGHWGGVAGCRACSRRARHAQRSLISRPAARDPGLRHRIGRHGRLKEHSRDRSRIRQGRPRRRRLGQGPPRRSRPSASSRSTSTRPPTTRATSPAPSAGTGPASSPTASAATSPAARSSASSSSESGIGPDTTIVLYGDNNNWFAAWAYWQLKLFGHRDVRILNGGRKFWLDNGLPLSTDPAGRQPPRATTCPSPTSRCGRSATTSCRGSARHGLRPRRRPLARRVQRRGHRPSGHERDRPAGRPHPGRGVDPVGPDGPRGRHVQEPRRAGRPCTRRRASRPTRTSSPTAGSASARAHSWFVLHELLGYQRVRNYDGSWTEWGAMVGDADREAGGRTGRVRRPTACSGVWNQAGRVEQTRARRHVLVAVGDPEAEVQERPQDRARALDARRARRPSCAARAIAASVTGTGSTPASGWTTRRSRTRTGAGLAHPAWRGPRRRRRRGRRTRPRRAGSPRCRRSADRSLPVHASSADASSSAVASRIGHGPWRPSASRSAGPSR